MSTYSISQALTAHSIPHTITTDNSVIVDHPDYGQANLTGASASELAAWLGY